MPIAGRKQLNSAVEYNAKRQTAGARSAVSRAGASLARGREAAVVIAELAGVRHRDRDESGAFAVLQANQHGLPAGLVRGLEPGLDVGRPRHGLAPDLEDHVAVLDAL